VEGNKGEAILSRGGFATLDKSGSTDTEVNRERGRAGREVQNWLPGTKFKVGQIWDSEIDPLSRVGVKGAESGGKLRSYRRPFHPHYCFLRRIMITNIVMAPASNEQKTAHSINC
jgi:hypothetical protein